MVLALPLFMASCSKNDGDWEPMKWKTEAKASKDGYLQVSPEGGTLTFWCTNYSSIWLNRITETDATGENHVTRDEKTRDGNVESMQSNWMTVKSEGNKLTITVSPTTSDSNRFMEVDVQNGDAFDTFKIKQSGSKGRIIANTGIVGHSQTRQVFHSGCGRPLTIPTRPCKTVERRCG